MNMQIFSVLRNEMKSCDTTLRVVFLDRYNIICFIQMGLSYTVTKINRCTAVCACTPEHRIVVDSKAATCKTENLWAQRHCIKQVVGYAFTAFSCRHDDDDNEDDDDVICYKYRYCTSSTAFINFQLQYSTSTAQFSTVLVALYTSIHMLYFYNIYHIYFIATAL